MPRGGIAKLELVDTHQNLNTKVRDVINGPVIERVVIPSTADASSPGVFLGNALILVPASRYELGAPCPKIWCATGGQGISM